MEVKLNRLKKKKLAFIELISLPTYVASLVRTPSAIALGVGRQRVAHKWNNGTMERWNIGFLSRLAP